MGKLNSYLDSIKVTGDGDDEIVNNGEIHDVYYDPMAEGGEGGDADEQNFANGGITFGTHEKSGPRLNEVPKLDDGGILMPPDSGIGDPFSVDTGSSDTFKTAHSPAALAAMPKGGPVQTSMVPPMPSPVARPPMAAAPSTAAPAPISPSVNPAVADYLSAQKAQLAKYGPEQQMAVEQALLKGRTGLGNSAALAGAGLGDAIMQGVARAGKSDFQANLMKNQDAQGQELMATLEKAHSGNLQNIEAGQKLDMASPTSPLSKSYQQAYAPVLSALGYSPKVIGSLPASQIETVTRIAAEYGGKKLEALMKQAEMNLKRTEIGVNAAGKVLEGSKIPGVPPSHEAKLRAEGTLEGALGQGAAPAPAASGWKYLGPVKQ